MEKETVRVEIIEDSFRSYRAPWKGQLVLVCRKCQGKLKHEGKKSGLGQLGKVLKKRARKDKSAPPLYVVNVSCLDLCPKRGVTVCTGHQIGARQCSIVRNSADVDALLDLCRQHSGSGENFN